jgi:hypothetical protein
VSHTLSDDVAPHIATIDLMVNFGRLTGSPFAIFKECEIVGF